MGGSLGGNLNLLMGMDPLPPPFHLERPLAFSAPSSVPGGTRPTIVSWSPTSMVSYHDNALIIIAGNMCCTVDVDNKQVSVAPPTWQTEIKDTTRSSYFSNLYFSSTSWLAGLPPDPEMWYRDDWTDAKGHSAAASFITQSRFDRYEIYSPIVRLWTTAIDTEQAVFSFQTNTDSSGQTYQPTYAHVRARLLLATGACDDYDNGNSTAPFAPPPAVSTGTCAGHGIGNTGTNILAHQDIYGFTHDVANDMRNATGRTLFLNDTGHSIHDERPIFFSQQIQRFLISPDNNINITLLTGSDDLRWNSEVHAIVSIPGNTIDVPLNYWFHPWPAGKEEQDVAEAVAASLAAAPVLAAVLTPAVAAAPGAATVASTAAVVDGLKAGVATAENNPCGLCYKLTAFHLPSGPGGVPVQSDFTIALPSGVDPGSVSSFQLKFIPGTASPLNTTDHWKLAGVAACLPTAPGGFVSDGFPPNAATLMDFTPGSAGQSMLWRPPSFQSPALSTRPKNCSLVATNPPQTTMSPKQSGTPASQSITEHGCG